MAVNTKYGGKKILWYLYVECLVITSIVISAKLLVLSTKHSNQKQNWMSELAY